MARQRQGAVANQAQKAAARWSTRDLVGGVFRRGGGETHRPTISQRDPQSQGGDCRGRGSESHAAVIAQRLGVAGERRVSNCHHRPAPWRVRTMELREGLCSKRRTQLQHRIRRNGRI